jgi:hypothetical protein
MYVTGILLLLQSLIHNTDLSNIAITVIITVAINSSFFDKALSIYLIPRSGVLLEKPILL